MWNKYGPSILSMAFSTQWNCNFWLLKRAGLNITWNCLLLSLADWCPAINGLLQTLHIRCLGVLISDIHWSSIMSPYNLETTHPERMFKIWEWVNTRGRTRWKIFYSRLTFIRYNISNSSFSVPFRTQTHCCSSKQKSAPLVLVR